MQKTIVVKFKTEKIGSECDIAFEISGRDWDGLDDYEKTELCLAEIVESGMFEFWYAEIE